MAISVSKNVSGCYLEYIAGIGTIEEVYAVQGLDYNDAYNYVTATGIAGIPAYQTVHPRATNLSVIGYKARPMGDEKSPNKSGCWVTVVYGTQQFIAQSVQIEVQTLNGTRTIAEWPYGAQAGQPILVGIELFNADGSLTGPGFPAQIDPNNAVDSSDFVSNKFYQPASFPVLESGLMLRFLIREVNPPPVNFRKHVNSTRWNGLDAGLWLCYSVSGKKTAPGSLGLVGWDNVYTFVSSPNLDKPAPLNGWTQVAVFKDRTTGKGYPSVDVLSGDNNGYTIFNPYPPANFASGLPNIPGNVYT